VAWARFPSSGVTRPICSGESIATVVARASQNPCELTDRPNAARVWRVILMGTWLALMPAR
jgi:hypothetical protein